MSIDVWEDGAAYEQYVGRWSRSIATEFVEWLSVPEGSAWLDFGCGTGALIQTILAKASPRLVVGCDRSAAYIEFARQQITDPRVQFLEAGLADLPHSASGFDACVTGLVLNFLPSPADAIVALTSRARRGAT